MKTIVIITHEPLTLNLKRIFYIEEYRQAGFEVEVWDISLVINNGLSLSDEVDDDALKKISSVIEFDKYCASKNNSSTIYILQFPLIWKNRSFARILSKYNCYCCNIEYYANAYTKSTTFEKLRKYLHLHRYPKLVRLKIEQYCYKLYCKRYKINIPQQNFTSLSLDKTSTAYINHPDYESYINIADKQISENDFILFIDNYFPLHPDLRLSQKTNPNEAIKYQQSLSSFFDILEKKYHMPVIIAAHPKAIYKFNTFGNRRIIKYRTAELVINATYIIQHTSNSISFAILADKPVALITTDGYNKVRHLSLALRRLARIMKLPLYNINKLNIHDFEFNKVPLSIRKEYIETYLHRDELGNSRNADILIQSYNNILQNRKKRLSIGY